MTDAATFADLRAALFQADRGLYVVPVRHHSPACAWALRRLIEEVQPAHVLVEGPADFTEQIPLLLDPGTVPPVALVALIDLPDGKDRVSGYYPFCAHSPEYVALQTGQAVGAALSFMDAPAADKAALGLLDGPTPTALASEHHFDSSDYVRALARKTGCRDGFELWDHLFETRLGQSDWRAFFGDVGVYCAGIRAATPPDRISAGGNDLREAHMAGAIAQALAKGGPVVAVVGGFHAPALVGDLAGPKPKTHKANTQAYLIRYGFRALDALNGYAAGLPQPGYYQKLWDMAGAGVSGQTWRDLGVDVMADFAQAMRKEGHPIALPVQVEAMRMAESLSLMRGRPGALRHDLLDGVKTALTKGEATAQDIWVSRFQEFLCGDSLGDVPPAAGSPPLVEDVRQKAMRHRFDLSDSQNRRRKLDIRRKAAHLDASRFLHALDFLSVGFARRESGPDYVIGHRTELLFEEWQYAWSPLVEGQLIGHAVLGDKLEDACLAHLYRARAEMLAEGHARDLPRMIDLLARGLLAGLGAELETFLTFLSEDIQAHGSFETVTVGLLRLMFILRSAGPIGAPEALDLRAVVQTAYARLIYLCDDLPATSDEQIEERLVAMRIITEILRDAAELGLDRSLLDEALDRVSAMQVPPVILGSVLSVCVQAGLRPAQELVTILSGQLRGVSLAAEDQIGVLRGLLATCPALLWHAEGLFDATDQFLTEIAEDQFLSLLPHLRLAFTALNPQETDRLARLVAEKHGLQVGAVIVQTASLSARDVQAALEVEQAVLKALAQDGLQDWIKGEVTP